MRTKIALKLWDQLWEEYSTRVNYAQTYQQMITQAGGTVANDHIAFRSLRLVIDTPAGKKSLGIDYLASIAEALGYSAVGEYTFAKSKLYARHYQHPEQNRFDLPKLFISELVVDELPEAIASLIYQTVSSCKEFLDVETLERAIQAASTALDIERISSKLQTAFTRPWSPPKRSVVETVNTVTQYGAWILLHGYAVNHFTGCINRQNTPKYQDIETTARGLALEVPMKAEIEGSRESGLRQTATQAVTEMVAVLDDVSDKEIHIPWTYAYYEIAERFEVEVAPGQKALFEGFQGRNAQHLFEMTRKVR